MKKIGRMSVNGASTWLVGPPGNSFARAWNFHRIGPTGNAATFARRKDRNRWRSCRRRAAKKSKGKRERCACHRDCSYHFVVAVSGAKNIRERESVDWRL